MPAFKRDLTRTLNKIRTWCASSAEYAVRFGIVQLTELFLDDAFDPAQLEIVAGIQRGEYYINMARAWYFSYALIKQPAAALPLFEARRLDTWTHNKALQKARESRRLSLEEKTHLQQLKVRKPKIAT